ncbi:serine/threonine-protein phosphatase 7 long form homolog isoform X2 [Carex rostrata]
MAHEMQGERTLLQLPHAQHQSHAANVTMVEVHRCQIDKGLITALVERWRPETNSFHLPVWECTVTLEDVSCLWGLSVTGKAISGYTDDNWSQLIEDCLGHEVYDGNEWDENDFYYKKVENSGQPNEKISILQNYMRLVWLRTNFANTELDGVIDRDIINRNTRAYAMELFGTIMFPDANSSFVRLMYLQFLKDLGPKGENYYNWGGAVLASYHGHADIKQVQLMVHYYCCRCGLGPNFL